MVQCHPVLEWDEARLRPTAGGSIYHVVWIGGRAGGFLSGCWGGEVAPLGQGMRTLLGKAAVALVGKASPGQ